MFKFTSNIIKTDVTALKVYNNYILIGIGANIHIYNLIDYSLLKTHYVFEGTRIYGIVPYENKILLHGENKVKIFNVNWDMLELTEIKEHESTDWILKARWLNSGENIVTISMHNKVEYFDGKMRMLDEITCEEMCILYCACASYDVWEELLVMAGTVFSEILMWRPAEGGGVLKRLKGHEGVLFSIHYKNGHIASTSDDRQLLLWKINDTKHEIDSELLFKACGHTARVFGCKVLSKTVISVGEDGAVCIWNFKGQLLRRLDAHQGGSVWTVESSEENDIIITGGGDGGVAVFPIEPKITNTKLCLRAEFVPKRVALMEDSTAVVITEDGSLFHCYGGEWSLVGQHGELKSYALLEVSNCRRKIGLAGFKGHIFIYKLSESQLKLMLSYQIKTEDRIFSLHWLTCDTFMTCGPNGTLFLWKLSEHEVLLFHVMQLPPSKERWSTAACLCYGGVAVGDRKGHVHIYYLDGTNRVQTIKRAHNYLGVTGMYYKGGLLISLGRNSTIKKYKHIAQSYAPVTSDKLPHSWLAKLSTHKSTDILLAFSGDNLILLDYNKRRVLLLEKCGGGHRSWDFNASTFAYIKDKIIHVNRFDWESLCPRDLICGINSSEINCLRTTGAYDKFILISGGEDTTLRMSKYEDNKFDAGAILKSHLSSIRCLHLINVSDGKCLLFSAGGRAQIIMWELIDDTCSELFSYYEPLDEEESEIRVMDMTSVNNNDELLLLTACSDGNIKIYNVADNKLHYKCALFYKACCILKIITIELNNLVATMATDGIIAFWDLTKTEPIFKHKAHQSGINSVSCKVITTNRFIMLTGGDDNAVALIMFEVLDGEVKVVDSYSNSSMHWAQITGVYVTDTLILSVSLDQKLFALEYKVDDDKIATLFRGMYSTTISDIKGMEVLTEGCNHRLILYGLGVEILQVFT